MVEPRVPIWPARPVLRILSFAWLLPVTVLGIVGAAVFAALGWARPVISDGAIDVVTRGPFARWMASRRWAAFTFGLCVWYWTAECGANEHIRQHEREHVRRFLRWGPIMLLAYPLASLWAALNGGHFYSDNAFERAARAAARDDGP